MSDGILNGVGVAELADYFNEVDLKYKWLQEPQTMTHSDEVAQLRAELEKIRVALRGYSDSDLVSLAEATQTRLTAAELILATLCDMVLGEDAKDRSNDALVRAVGEMKRERNAAIADRDNALIDVRNMQARLQRIIDANTQATRKLRAAIETQPQALPGSPDLVDELIAQRDAAILDARKLAQNWNGVMTSVEIESIVKKYLQQQ